MPSYTGFVQPRLEASASGDAGEITDVADLVSAGPDAPDAGIFRPRCHPDPRAAPELTIRIALEWPPMVGRTASRSLSIAQAPAPGPRRSKSVVDAEKAWAGADVLWPLAQTADPATSPHALRALGRLEDPALVPRILLFIDARIGRPYRRGSAVAQSLRTPGDPVSRSRAAGHGASSRLLERHTSVEDSHRRRDRWPPLPIPNAGWVDTRGAHPRRGSWTTRRPTRWLAPLRATALASFEVARRACNARVARRWLEPGTIRSSRGCRAGERTPTTGADDAAGRAARDVAGWRRDAGSRTAGSDGHIRCRCVDCRDGAERGRSALQRR